MTKYPIKTSIFIAVITFNLFAPSFALPQTVNDTIIAIVNKDVITLKDLREFLSALYVQLRSEGQNEADVRQKMAEYEKTGIEKLIEQKLMVDESIKKEIIMRPEAISLRIEEVRKSYPSEKDFLAAIVKEGLTVTELKKRIEDELRVKYIVDTEVKRKIFVNPKEVTEYYQQHLDSFKKSERVDLDSIFISYPNADVKTAEKKAQEALNLIKNGQEFKDVAKKYSEMPSIGMVSKGKMLPVIENAIFSLKDAEVSAPVKTETGIFIFKLKGKHPPETATLEETREDISGLLYRQKFQKQLAAWLDDLKKKAYVEIKN